MVRDLRVITALCGAALIAGAAPAIAPAAPVWRSIETPAGSGGAHRPQLAFDAHGNALLTWRADQPGEGFRQVRYAWRPRNGTLGPAGPISDYGASSHAVAVGWTGEAIATWRMQDESVHAAVSPGPGQPFGGHVVLGQPDAQSFFGEPEVAVDDLGNAVVAWMRYGRGSTIPSGAMIATRSEGGSFGAPIELGPAGFGGAIDVATNGAGLFAVAWRGPDNRTHVAVREPGAADFGPPEAVDLVGPGPQVSVAPDGTIVVRNSPGAALGPMAGPGVPAAVVRPAGSAAFGPQGPVPDLGLTLPADVADLTVATATGGAQLATWTERLRPDGTAVPSPIRFAERAAADQPWSAPQPPPGDPLGAWVTGAISRLGSIGIAWAGQYAASPTEPVALLVREDPDAVVPPRPTRSTGPGEPPPTEPPAVEPSLSAQAARGGAVRATVTCLTACRVRGEVRVAGRTAGRLKGRRVPAATPSTVVLAPGERLARAIRRARRDDRRVVVRLEVRAGGETTATRRLVLR